jgi:hypothetical protein
METQTIYDYLYQPLAANVTVQADCGGRVYEDEAPGEADYPFVIISLLSPEDITGVNNARCSVTSEVLVRAVGLGNDMARLIRVGNAIDEELSNHAGGSGVATITRLRPFRTSGYENGILFKNLGGIYAVETGA